jgi:two-component system chemotaxis sensor kinase CheA
VRVESNRLDDLFDQAESLLAAKSFASEHLKAINEIRALLASIQASNAHLDSEPGNDVELAVRRAESLSASAEEFSRSFSTLVNGLVESMKDVLMLSFDTVLAPFAKVVRDLGRTQGKEIELRTVGESVEADKRVLEGLKEPLTHLVRNAADHGIEVPAVRIAAGKSPRGLIEIAITRHDDRVQIRVADDGNGVDTERLRVGEDSVGCGVSALELIFRSGISTRDIADEVSGRGLGLAIVRERIESLGGAVSVQTTPGKGTAFLLDLPTKLATFRGTFIALDDQIFVIPTRSVERVFRLQPDTVFPIKGKPMLSVSGRAVPLVNLHTVFAGPGVSAKRGTTCVLVQTGGSRIALEVERVIEEREIVVKNLGPQIKRARYFSGATIIESGKVVPVLKVAGLLGESSRQEPAAAEESKPPKQSVAEGKTVLLVEDSVTSRMLLKGLLETAGFRVRTAVNGVEALKLLNQTPFDLVVSDIEMPEMDGVELTEHIRADAQFGGTPVVLVTSLGSAEDIQRGLDAGANAYFPKASFDHERLLETVSGLI